MKRILTILFSLAFGVLSFSLHATENTLEQLLTDLSEESGFYKLGQFQGEDGIKIKYIVFANDQKGPNGAVVISPGRTETGIKYLELANDLIHQGYSPVFAIDHRGQGLSGRILKEEPEKGSVRDFHNYARDFNKFTQLIVLNHPMVKEDRLFLIGHSMGGAIVADYLESYEHPYKAVVLTSPMFKLKFNNDESEDDILKKTQFVCDNKIAELLGHFVDKLDCDRYAVGGGYSKQDLEKSYVTSSPERHKFTERLLERFPEARLGGPTVRWVWQSILSIKQIRSESEASKIATSILVLSAGDEKYVDVDGVREFCSSALNCESNVYSNGIERPYNLSRHEILFEVDEIRDYALQEIIDFFESNRH